MRIFIARHGQVLPRHFIDSDPNLPKADPPLSPLGLEQAALLGQRMREMGFTGPIYSSPFRRTLMTAQGVARMTGSVIFPAFLFREIVKESGQLADFAGLTMAQIMELFPEARDSGLPYPWWSDEAESTEDVFIRVAPFVEEIMEKGEDCLLVGHGASVGAANRLLLQRSGKRLHENHKVFNYNCSLSEVHVDTGKVRVIHLYDIAHIPLEQVSSNAVMALEECSLPDKAGPNEDH